MRLHRTRHPITELGDMNEITEEEVPAHHIMIATPPCKDFSTAGKGEGPNGQHSTSMPKIPTIMMWNRPLVMCMEEV